MFSRMRADPDRTPNRMRNRIRIGSYVLTDVHTDGEVQDVVLSGSFAERVRAYHEIRIEKADRPLGEAIAELREELTP